MPDVTAYVAPARYALTVLHRPDPRRWPQPAAGEPVAARTACGEPMLADELWVPVERRDGDRVCPGCAGAAEDVQEALL